MPGRRNPYYATVVVMKDENGNRDAFQATVWKFYEEHGRRDLPWRQPEAGGVAAGGSRQTSQTSPAEYFDPYKILVSELMLQQTQVSRVIPKYLEFLERFPTVQALAAAPLGDVLVAWQGLGYNRRAKFLWQAAQMVANEMGGEFPRDQKELTRLPGVGINTAGAVMAYAYDEPVAYLETNIRTVYIHHFFHDHFEKLADGGPAVPDKEIEALVAQTVPRQNAREWYWALMDYGTHIKQQFGNKSRASKSYAKQSPFEGSRRKVRGAVIRYLSQQGGRAVTYDDLATTESDARLPEVLSSLVAEGMLRQDSDGRYSLG